MYRQRCAEPACRCVCRQVGFIMFYVRSPTEGGQEAINEALSVLWQLVPSVQGINFKDLKQTLRKEQCDVRARHQSVKIPKILFGSTAVS